MLTPHLQAVYVKDNPRGHKVNQGGCFSQLDYQCQV